MHSVISFNGRQIRASTFRLTGLVHDGLRQRQVTPLGPFGQVEIWWSSAEATLSRVAYSRTTGQVLRRAEEKMADQVQWQLSGDYFENCGCNAVCPCLVSKAAPLTSKPTQGVCNVPLVFHIEKGRYDGIALDGLNVALAI